MKNKVFMLILVCFANQYMFGQISEGGTPISFTMNIEKSKIPTIVMESVDVQALIQEDENTKENDTLSPFKFGVALDVDIDLKKVGLKEELSNGDKLWLLKINSPDAYSINLIYNHFYLSKGSKFFIYNEDRTMVLGAFTSEVSNNQYNVFATDLVQGNTIVLEYYEPSSFDNGVISINKVIHGYINTFSSEYSNGYGTSANCNTDVNCPLGNGWDSEKRAVAMLLVDQNTAFCTGCLVNNTQLDNKPYILTANHCITPSTNPTTSIFRFKYWKPSCNSGNPSNWNSITGATLRANYAPTDFALLQLNSGIPMSYDVHYAGWDRTSTPAQNAMGIHHPKGDAMKICYDAHPVVAVSWPGIVGQNFWRANFDQGIVQHGSSGSPLFNQAHRIVGQLYGNQNNICGNTINDNPCHCAQTPIGEYGRFDISWTGGGTSSSRLSDWLAPGIANPPNSLSGMNTCVPIFDEVDGPTSVDPDGTQHTYYAYYSGYGGVPTNYSWSVGGAPSSWYSITSYGGTAYVSFYGEATYYVYVYMSNSCGGAGGQVFVEAYNRRSQSPAYTVYPNPVDDILSIDIQQTLSNANKPLRYDIHLYDLQGNLMRQTTANQAGIVQVNVSGLPDGNYFLHIYDGTGAKPYMKQIVVKH